MIPFEAWCPRCKVTWAPGTRTCVHCGGRVTASRTTVAAPAFAREADAAEPPARSEEPTSQPVVRPLRIGIATLWVVVAVAGAIVRHCAQQ